MSHVSLSLPGADTAGQKNLLLLIQLRWMAVAGQLLTILVVELWFRIHLPLVEMLSVVAFLSAVNLVSIWRQQRLGPVTNAELLLELLADMAAFTAQLYLSGGVTNPFVSLYLVQVGLGAVLLETWSAWTVVAVATGCFIALASRYKPLLVPKGLGEDLFGLQVQGMLVCFLLTASLLILFVSRVQKNLRERDAHLADLRQQSAEEDHIVRIGLLASGAAHELSTPLSTLSVILADWARVPAIRGDGDLAGELREMRGQIDRCKSIVSGILMSSGEARGEDAMRSTACAFFDGLVEEWRGSRSPRRLDYANRLPPHASIISDTTLKQVIFNVFDNALEASPDWVGVSVEEDGGELVVTVRDAGPGFPAEILAEFGKPYRSSKSRPGSGLGLFLVVNVMRKLGGRVAARNEGEGACVALILPLSAMSVGGAGG